VGRGDVIGGHDESGYSTPPKETPEVHCHEVKAKKPGPGKEEKSR